MLSWLRRKAHSARVYLLGGLLGVVGGVAGCTEEEMFPEETPYAGEIKDDVTDKKGKAHFVDSGSLEDVVIQVQDKEEKPVSDASVIFFDGDDHEAYYVTDPSGRYLPSLVVFPHNSVHTIPLCEAEERYCVTQVFGENDEFLRAFLSWQDGVREEEAHYVSTIDREDRVLANKIGMFVVKLGAGQAIAGIATFAGADVGLSEGLESIAKDLAGNLTPVIPDYPRWDIYTRRFKKGVHEAIRRTARGLEGWSVYVPSNIPWTVSIEYQQERQEGRFRLDWEGTDKTEYDKIPEGFLPRSDLTILEGETRGSDLRYKPKIFREDTGELIFSFAEPNSGRSISWGTYNGTYRIQVATVDEVGNQSEPKVERFIVNHGQERPQEGMQSQPPRTPEPQNCIPYRTRECSQDGLWVLLVTACTQHETTPVKDCITTNGPNYRCVEGECVEQQQPPPPPQARCTSDGDCITDYCKAGVCAQPINYENCHDQRKNGGESDIDCGQVCPTKCDLEEFCLTAADCVTNYCNFGMCEERQQPEPENGICGTYRIGPPELLELSEGCNRDYLYDIPWGEFYMEIDSRNVRAWINEADGLHQE